MMKANKTYGFLYQLIVTWKVFFGSKILEYRNFDINHIIAHIQRSQNKGYILDLGCNTGYLTRKLAANFGSKFVYGADINKRALKSARRRSRDIRFLNISSGFYKNHKRKYSFILLVHVLEHINNPLEFLRNVRNILAKNGTLIICVPQERIRGDSAFFENIYNMIRLRFENVHRVKYSYKKLSALLKDVGFSVFSRRYVNGFKEHLNKKCISNHSLIAFARNS